MLIKIGSHGEDVKEVQEKLHLTPDGDFGHATEQAVKKWQEAHGLSADGIIGRDTWNDMFALRVGSPPDEHVKELQEKLHLTPDGNFGPVTEQAVKKWQEAHNLTADGIVGFHTWNELFDDSEEDSHDTEIEDESESAVSATPVTDIDGLNLSKLKGHVPDIVLSQIPDCAAKFQINTPLRLAHFLAQCTCESVRFKTKQENLRYSANRLRVVFRKYFPSMALAKSYARQPEKIASHVYANRMGNGNEASKEGYKYRGRGFIQLTGKCNYKSFNETIDDDVLSNPDLVSGRYPLLSAAWYWNSRSLNHLADQGSTTDVVKKITRKVNGGTHGLADRIKFFKEYHALLG